jgi:uncharacterized membrane protein
MKTATVLEVLATCLLGLMAGFFFAFWVDVAPAMRELTASEYIRTQQAINRVVRNAWFAIAYFGAAILPLAAAAALWLARRRYESLVWVGIAVIYIAGVFLLTREVNVPINNALAGWNPASPPADWMIARDRWNDANLVRGLLALAAFAAAVVMQRLPRR